MFLGVFYEAGVIHTRVNADASRAPIIKSFSIQVTVSNNGEELGNKTKLTVEGVAVEVDVVEFRVLKVPLRPILSRFVQMSSSVFIKNVKKTCKNKVRWLKFHIHSNKL